MEFLVLLRKDYKMGKINSKKKGSRGELELANYLKEKGFLSARRTAQFCGKSGEAADIVCDELSKCHIECKRCESLSLYKAMNQAETDCLDRSKFPLVAHRRSNEKWLAVLSLDHFLEIFQGYQKTLL